MADHAAKAIRPEELVALLADRFVLAVDSLIDAKLEPATDASPERLRVAGALLSLIRAALPAAPGVAQEDWKCPECGSAVLGFIPFCNNEKCRNINPVPRPAPPAEEPPRESPGIFRDRAMGEFSTHKPSTFTEAAPGSTPPCPCCEPIYPPPEPAAPASEEAGEERYYIESSTADTHGEYDVLDGAECERKCTAPTEEDAAEIAAALNRDSEVDADLFREYTALYGELLYLFGLRGDMPGAGGELLRRVRELVDSEAARQREGEPLPEHPGHCPTDGCSLDRGHVEPCDSEPVAPPEGEQPFRVVAQGSNGTVFAWNKEIVEAYAFGENAYNLAARLNRLFSAWAARSAPAAPAPAETVDVVNAVLRALLLRLYEQPKKVHPYGDSRFAVSDLRTAVESILAELPAPAAEGANHKAAEEVASHLRLYHVTDNDGEGWYLARDFADVQLRWRLRVTEDGADEDYQPETIRLVAEPSELVLDALTGAVTPAAAPPPAAADRELREAARPFAKAIRGYDDSFVGLAAAPPSDEEECSGYALANLTFGDWRRLRAALDRSPAVPAPPALDEEVRELMAAAEPFRQQPGPAAHRLDEAVGALERKAGEARNVG